MKRITQNKYYIMLALGIGALISVVVLCQLWTSVKFHAESIAYINEQIGNVMSLTAASSAASASISLLPGDAGIPIANQLASFSSEFMLILCGLYLEKYLLIITGYIAFYGLIPAGCLFGIIYQYNAKAQYKQIAMKLCAFAVLLLLTIPVSIQISKAIDEVYHFSTIEIVDQANEITTTPLPEENKENDWFGGFVDSVQNGISSITSNVSDAVEEGKMLVSNFIEAIAVMIITSCVIPILVFMILLWGSRSILGIDYNNPDVNKLITFKSRNKE
ncbi:MAG: hypothetical protein MR210_05450 [Erysipelotrichaceae bacterium]|nr:hypothetical protein [Erysipelotrichaceae bacterium]MDY5251962.1 hypothetical protein [Erysipelotrichaceae bacterium]